MKTTATKEQLERALAHVNKSFDNNITWKREPHAISSKRNGFTLTVKDSSKPGGRRSHTGRRVAAACWHVHGEFFEFLFEDGVNFIQAGRTVMKDNRDNWMDWNIGSIAQPMYYSEACECY